MPSALLCFAFDLAGLLVHGQAALTSAERENKAQRQLVFPVIPSLNLENCVIYYNHSGVTGWRSNQAGFQLHSIAHLGEISVKKVG